MLSDHVISGEVSQYEEPDWEPLRELVGMELADFFMWMFEIELHDGTTVHAYKHIDTRRYFHLGVDGRAFAYMPRGLYRELEPRHAIDLVFVEWDKYLAERDDPAAVRRALKAARRAATARASRQASAGAGRDDRPSRR